LAGSTTQSSRKARIIKRIEYPAYFFGRLLEGRLEKHWVQTYALIGFVSNAFIALVTFIVEPKFLPPTNLTFFIVTPILGIFVLLEYLSFLQRIHRKTIQLYDSAPCKLKLTILRVHMKRKLLTAVTFALNFAFSLFALTGVPVAFLTAGIPYYFTLNAASLLGFRISSDKELDTVFEAVPQLRTLDRFYQTRTMRIIRERMKKRLREQVPLADDIDPDRFLRRFYLDHVIAQQSNQSTSPVQSTQISDDLKKALAPNGDLLALLNQQSTQVSSTNDVVTLRILSINSFCRIRILP